MTAAQIAMPVLGHCVQVANGPAVGFSCNPCDQLTVSCSVCHAWDSYKPTPKSMDLQWDQSSIKRCKRCEITQQ